jgi:protein-S-isoprenylcysteine O-methyltransferase Ste14
MDTNKEHTTTAEAHDLRTACPQSLSTGFAGALVVAVGAVLLCLWRVLTRPSVPNRAEYVVLIVVACLVMGLIEVLVFRVHRHQFDFGRRRRLTPDMHMDVARQFGALIATLALAWGGYRLFGEYVLRFAWFFDPQYEESWYAPFFDFFKRATPVLVALAVPYFYVCAAFRRWGRDDDELLQLWRGYTMLASVRGPDPAFWAAIRSLLVKFFFIPVMTVFLLNNAEAFEDKFIRFLAGSWVWDTAFIRRLFDALYEGLFLLDVNLALLGYICCFRILDTHIRSAEPTFLGWAVALACYPPFNHRLTGLYIPNNTDGQTWSAVFSGMPWLYSAIGAAILLLLGVYLYATIAFGLRFSNLTHRGILCRGPYRWVRHPAYAAKNLAWWLLSLPFLVSPVACMRLLLLNGIYVLRALTEEKHLSRDPVYRDYMKQVKWRFIPGVF